MRTRVPTSSVSVKKFSALRSHRAQLCEQYLTLTKRRLWSKNCVEHVVYIHFKFGSATQLAA